MRKPTALLASLALGLTLFGCATTEPTTVAPGDGPAATAEPSGPVEGEPSFPTEQPSQLPVAKFNEKITYPDGVVLEVIRIRHTRLSDVGFSSDDQKAGDPVQILSVRVTNKSQAVVDVSAASGTMSYGPDGQEAATISDEGTNSLTGKVLPGRAKTGTYGFAVPARYLGDVVLEFNPSFDHATAVFAGSIK